MRQRDKARAEVRLRLRIPTPPHSALTLAVKMKRIILQPVYYLPTTPGESKRRRSVILGALGFVKSDGVVPAISWQYNPAPAYNYTIYSDIIDS